MLRRRAATLASLSLGSLLAAALLASPARADVREDAFAVAASFDAALFGRLSLDDDVNPKVNPAVGGSLRLEALFATHFAVGAEGVASWTGTTGTELLGEASFAIFDGNGYLRLRMPLDDGRAEYYLIAGAGPSFLPYDDTDPRALGQAVGAGATVGWNVFGRAGVRAELVDGFGMLIEVGYRRRQIDGALLASDAGGASYDYVADRLSLVIGWYGAL